MRRFQNFFIFVFRALNEYKKEHLYLVIEFKALFGLRPDNGQSQS